MQPLSGFIQEYAWGSKTALPQLLGHAATGRPQAELWLGAHPRGPARLPDQTLIEHIALAPHHALGAQVRGRWGERLPFLLKVLAVEAPLSLQVHPNEQQAREGFAREQALGLDVDDPKRSYKDTSHKPELVVALTRFEALCGFRRPEAMVERLSALNVADLRSTVQMLEGWPDAVGVQGVVHGLLGMSESERVEVMGAVTRALEARVDRGEEFARAYELARLYPGDVGALLTLMLNHVVLEPGQALYMPAGNLHAYLKGMAIELMAASDNTLRGGLTPKHVDVPEVLATLQYDLGSVPVLTARRESEEEVWDVPAAEFRLSRINLARGAVAPGRRGPEILLCVDGEASVDGHALSRGSALWVDAADAGYAVTGRGVVFRACVGG
jgi:mannose-6-phosphate isomerase